MNETKTERKKKVTWTLNEDEQVAAKAWVLHLEDPTTPLKVHIDKAMKISLPEKRHKVIKGLNNAVNVVKLIKKKSASFANIIGEYNDQKLEIERLNAIIEDTVNPDDAVNWLTDEEILAKSMELDPAKILDTFPVEEIASYLAATLVRKFMESPTQSVQLSEMMSGVNVALKNQEIDRTVRYKDKENKPYKVVTVGPTGKQAAIISGKLGVGYTVVNRPGNKNLKGITGDLVVVMTEKVGHTHTAQLAAQGVPYKEVYGGITHMVNSIKEYFKDDSEKEEEEDKVGCT